MHCNIPIFIPQLACPHACIFCNQKYISGQQKAPSMLEVKETIETYLSTLSRDDEVELAFFGGSFTGISMEMQNKYLQLVQPYIKEGRIGSIRLSTRPDYINTEILDNLKKYNVKDIELGAQSLDDEVLQFSERGHSVEDVYKASELIKLYGFNLGLQMMIGLPLDTKQKSIHTAKTILSLGAKTTRIYPTLVIEHTKLARLYKESKYKPLTLTEAINWTKDIYKVFLNSNIKVLRVGLHPSKDIVSGEGFLAGPFHISFFELVLTEIWKERLQSLIKPDTKEIILNPKDVNHIVGYNSANKDLLKNIKLIQNSDISQGQIQVI